jgi:BASS family bile acid:Na+ symporter
MDSLITVFLPLALAIIMFSLGLGLTTEDFRRILTEPKAFLAGAFAQLVLIPVIAYGLVLAFRLPPALAVGVMILAFCPGGVTANLLTKLAGGTVALSISLTGAISLLSVFTVPVLVSLTAAHFLGVDAPPIDVTALGLSMVVITFVPVLSGIALRHLAPRAALALDRVVSRLALVLFCVVVVGAIAANWRIFADNIAALGPVLVILNILLLAVGLGLARALSLTPSEGKAIALETGVQNATLGITVGALITAQAGALPVFSLPSGVYGITMYLVSIPFVFWLRRRP